MPKKCPTFGAAEFQMVDTTDEQVIVRSATPLVRSLHGFLNDLSSLSDLQRTQRRWKSRVAFPDAFGNLATDPRHWYTFHHGGRNEAQFNIGLFPTHLRIGLGFEFTLKKGGDPTVVHLATHVSPTWSGASGISSSSSWSRIAWNLSGLTIAVGRSNFVPSNQVVDWLLNPPKEPGWIFVGRLLKTGGRVGPFA